MQQLRFFLVLIIFIKFSNFIFCQSDIERRIYDTIYKTNDIWVVEYDFRNQIDSIKYDSIKNIGIIETYNKSGDKIEVSIYKNPKLLQPVKIYYSSKKELNKFYKENIYDGKTMEFPEEYLIQRINYYESNQIKEIQVFEFGQKPSELITFDPKTLNSTKENVVVFSEIKTGNWYFFSEEGDLLRIEKYQNDKLIEIINCR